MIGQSRTSTMWWEVACGLYLSLSFLLLAQTRLPLPLDEFDQSLLVLLGALVLLTWRGFEPSRTRLPVPLAAMLGFAALSLSWSTDRSATVIGLITFGSLALAGLLVATQMSLRTILTAVAITAVAILLVSYLTAWFDPAIGITQDEYNPGTLRGFFYGRNDLSHGIAFGVPALIAVPIRRGFALPVKVIGITFLLSGMVAADTSTAIVTVLIVVPAGMLLWLIGRVRPGRRWIPTVAGGALLAVAALVVALNSDRFFSALGRTSTLTGRTSIWDAAVQVAAERPVLGFGWDAVWSGPAGAAIKAIRPFPGDHPHNGLIEVGLELGAIGVLLFLAMHLSAGALGVRQVLASGARSGSLWAPIMVLFTLVYDLAETFSLDALGWLVSMIVIGVAYSSRPEARGWTGTLPLVARGVHRTS